MLFLTPIGIHMKNMLFAALIAALLMLAGCAQQPQVVTDEHGCVTSSGESWCNYTQMCIGANGTCTAPVVVGGDRDAHGCIPSAGYSWCDVKQKCLRPWEEPCVAGTHDMAWARGVAEASSCMEKGNLTDQFTFNENSNTWWIDMEVANAPGCAPACVVYEGNSSAEINWRCTGALPPSEQSCVSNETGNSMMLEDARGIAAASAMCGAEGTLKDTAVCNDITATWWIDINPKIAMQGCSPACVVNVNSRTAEVNYRCTGLNMGDQAALPAINTGGSACFSNLTGKSISLARAINISLRSVCRKVGTLDATKYVCQNGTITFGINPVPPIENCNPACVISVEMETASVDWKCTGLVPQFN